MNAAADSGNGTSASAETVPLHPDARVQDAALLDDVAVESAIEVDGGVTTPVGPRVRWAAVIWGTVFIALAMFGLLAVTNAGVQQMIGDWWFALTPTTLTATAVLVAGAIGLVCALVALARRGQHALARHRSAS